ncbi:hypothetical protein PHAVU_006G063200 [Phaseolus vulgaris]|uniref:Uncharacterized protein n=1 Tax=Phaseolus vulgaris TaxID=3885 RepID=V7BQ48_PHAVU|nr:hypothetical protein PHAVU_006G063200g [Phaseolus vulgaris]ESW18706.1 hypothetical protein PHAVU_006G063200g [Phaseolus vulgaris]
MGSKPKFDKRDHVLLYVSNAENPRLSGIIESPRSGQRKSMFFCLTDLVCLYILIMSKWEASNFIGKLPIRVLARSLAVGTCSCFQQQVMLLTLLVLPLMFVAFTPPLDPLFLLLPLSHTFSGLLSV